jgi:hypothetical protein
VDRRTSIRHVEENLHAVEDFLKMNHLSQSTRKELLEYRDQLRKKLRDLLEPDTSAAAD